MNISPDRFKSIFDLKYEWKSLVREWGYVTLRQYQIDLKKVKNRGQSLWHPGEIFHLSVPIRLNYKGKVTNSW